MPESSIPTSSASGSTSDGSQGPLQRLQTWLERRRAPTNPESTSAQEPSAANGENRNSDNESNFINPSAGRHESTRTSAWAFSEEDSDEEGHMYPMTGQAAGYDNPDIYGMKARHHRQTRNDVVVQQGPNNWRVDRNVTGAEKVTIGVKTPRQTFNNGSVTVPKDCQGTVPAKGSYRFHGMTFNNLNVEKSKKPGPGSER